MELHLIAVGNRMPTWVGQGFADYARRLPRECRLVLHEIAPGRRGKGSDIARALADEWQRMQLAIPKAARPVALAVDGRGHTTAGLAARLEAWLAGGQDIALLVGGPEGLHPEALAASAEQWSLSPLTLPHPLVRIVVAESLYRAWSLTQNHPYHRE